MLLSIELRLAALISLALVLPALVLPALDAGAEDSLRLKVLTYNVWGIPVITPSRSERIDRIVPAIAAFGPHLVALQEVWVGEDAERIEAALERAGFQYVERFGASWPGNSGLMIASVYPIRDVAFKAFTLGSKIFRPWHLDFIANKGLARVTVETPLGIVEFAGTHLQAPYDSTYYLPIQLSQMIEAGKLLGELGRKKLAEHPPLILAGDLNAHWFELPTRLLRARAAFLPAGPEQAEDSVHYRPGTAIRIRSLGVKRVLEEPFDLGDGVSMPLSDHPAILAELELARGGFEPQAGCGHECAVVEIEALERIDEDLEDWENTTWAARLGGMLMLAALVVAGRRGQRARRRLALALCTVFLAFAGWCGYVGLVSGPTQIDGLTAARADLLIDLEN